MLQANADHYVDYHSGPKQVCNAFQKFYAKLFHYKTSKTFGCSDWKTGITDPVLLFPHRKRYHQAAEMLINESAMADTAVPCLLELSTQNSALVLSLTVSQKGEWICTGHTSL